MNPALMMLLRGPAASGGGTLACDYVSTAETTTSGAVQTFSSQAIGDAASDRTVIVVGMARGTAGLASVAVTVGGTSATVHAVHYFTGTGSAVWVATAPLAAGTTANIVATYDQSQLRGAISVYRATGASVGYLDSDSSAAETPHSYTLTSATGGFAVGGGAAVTAADNVWTWTGLDEDVDSRITGAVTNFTAAHATTSSAAGIAVTAAVSTECTSLAATFQPT